ncbi:MAG: ABC transporter permease [Marinifilaceae bacterium]
MLLNNLKIAFRNLIRNKAYSFINISGLAIGMACTIFIALWVNHETSYDSHHEKADRIYRVCESINLNGRPLKSAITPPLLAETMVQEFPEVENAVRFYKPGTSIIINYQKQTIWEPSWAYADSTLLDVFTLPLLKGNPKKVLRAPNTILLSKKISKKIFKDQDPIGQLIELKNRGHYVVEGVYQDIPSNSHFQFGFIASLSSLPSSRETNWLYNDFQTYILLHPKTNVSKLTAKFDDFILRHLRADAEQMLGKSVEEIAKGGSKLTFFLQPLRKIYLNSDLEREIGPTGDIRYIYVMLAIGLFILIIACINFMNLSTAQSLKRAREVGIRKTLGAKRARLMLQFFGESLLLSFIGLNFALVITQLTLPFFNSLAQKDLRLDYTNITLIIEMVGIVGITGIFAGLYPATYLSSFQPIKTLKGLLQSNKKAGIFRSSLVIFQFSASIILIIATLVVLGQLNFIRNKKLGYNRENVLILYNTKDLGNSIKSFRQELLNNPQIKNVTITGYLPTPSERGSTNVFIGKHSAKEDFEFVNTWPVDMDYTETLGLEIIHGRNFSKDLASDSTAALINEAAYKKFGWTNFEERILSRMTDNEGTTKPMKIIGVVKNFHYETLHKTIVPLVLYFGDNKAMMAIRYKTKDLPALIENVNKTWKKFSPNQRMSYNFMDDAFEYTYNQEKRTASIFGIFTLLSILIACMGLFGLAAFTAERKIKEIGVRRVLGASIGNLIIMLVQQFSKWVLIASVISCPIAYLLMGKWLENFKYHTQLSWWHFALGSLSALLIAVGTTTYQAWRSATRNPVESLKCE